MSADSSYHRKCAKCSKTSAEDKSVRFFQFPKPIKNDLMKSIAWAKYCWPTQDWTYDSLLLLNTKRKVLCGRHFSSSEFYDNKRQRLSKFAVPNSVVVKKLLNTRENIFNPDAEPPAKKDLSGLTFSQPQNIAFEKTTSYHVLALNTFEDISNTFEPTCSIQNNVPPVEQLVARLSSTQHEHNAVEPKTSDLVSARNIFVDITKTFEPTCSEQNVSSAEQLESRSPSISDDVSAQETFTENSKSIEPTCNEQNTHTKTTVPVKHKKFSVILSAINASKLNELTTRQKHLYEICLGELREILRLQEHLKNKKISSIEEITADENVQNLCNLNINNSLVVLLQSQLKNCPRIPKRRRYTINEKIMASVIYKKSPACYSLLRRLFALPCKSNLNHLLSTVPLTPGINKHIFYVIRKRLDEQIDEANICVLSFNEMSIKQHVFYDREQDKILSFQDHGNNGTNNQIPSKALVFMLAGIKSKWKQPIAFYFSLTHTADRITVILKEILTECFNHNLNVVATVCHLSTVNLKVLEALGATTKDPYFVHGGREIVAVLDPPHLLKCTRDLLMKHDVECTIVVQGNDEPVKGIVKWSHFEQFYQLDKDNPIFVFAPALTDHHLKPNNKQQMKVELATQVFSHTVTAGMFAKIASNELPVEAHATAIFANKFDELFDAVNADTPYLRRGKKYSRNLTLRSPHIALFAEMRNFICTMRYLGSESKPPSQDGWIHTLNAIERLWKNLRLLKIKTLSTRRLNLDALEIFFDCIRSNCGSEKNPRIQQFVAGAKTAILSNLRHSGRRQNCEDDNAELLDNLASFLPSEDNLESNEIEGLLAVAVDMVTESEDCAYVRGFICT